jgi:hypothetical protein
MGGGVVFFLVFLSTFFFALQRELLQTHTPNEDNRDKWWPIGQQLKHGIRCLQFQTLSFSLRLSVSFIHATVHYLSSTRARISSAFFTRTSSIHEM